MRVRPPLDTVSRAERVRRAHANGLRKQGIRRPKAWLAAREEQRKQEWLSRQEQNRQAFLSKPPPPPPPPVAAGPVIAGHDDPPEIQICHGQLTAGITMGSETFTRRRGN